jgi:hypothetical protein
MAELTLQSDPGDSIGQGHSFDITYTPQNSSLFNAQVQRRVGGLPASLFFIMGTVTSGADNTFVTLTFGTDQLGIPIQPGTYTNAQRAAFAAPGHPGLDVSFQNRGCNTVTGSFTINEVTFSDPNTIATFSASFEQHCEGVVAALHGTFVYGPSAIAFSVFCARIAINVASGSFAVRSAFTPGTGGTITPATQDVTFKMGDYSVKIPARSFQQQEDGGFAFEGAINGVALEAGIRPSDGGYSFRIEGAGAPGLPTKNPVALVLTMGKNTGSPGVCADFGETRGQDEP